MLSAPLPNSTVHGEIEFYGDGQDDARAVRAEFFVDGTRVYSDTAADGHFHYGGVNGHSLERYATTQLTDGTHVFRMTVYDARDQAGSAEVMVTVNNSGGAGGGSGRR